LKIQKNIQKSNIEDYSCTVYLDLSFEEEALEREFEVMCGKPDINRILTKIRNIRDPKT
jgi:hypothetical protein